MSMSIGLVESRNVSAELSTVCSVVLVFCEGVSVTFVLLAHFKPRIRVSSEISSSASTSVLMWLLSLLLG